MMTVRLVMAMLTVLVLVPALSGSAADASSWHATGGEVRIVCPLTVGGSFEARTTTLGGSLTAASQKPPSFEGSLSIDLRSLDTGISLRNDHLRDKYLEVGKGDGFDRAVLSGISIGDADPEAFQGRTTFTGNLTLHGVTRAITGQADIRRTGASTRIEAGFPIVLADFGIAKPRYLGVGVKDQVQAKVTLVATLTKTAEAR